MERLAHELDLQQQFGRLDACFARCASAARTTRYAFGGRAVCMRIAGDGLARRITRPFGHLRSEM